MANSRRRLSEINAGSMADIAFLLLIFFLVVSTIDEDVGIKGKLPKLCETEDCIIDINHRNLLTIKLGNNNELMINDELQPITNLKQKIIDFVDNNGDKSCDFCDGSQLSDSSDNPNATVISILSSREANYNSYIRVQDELIAAYFELRREYVRKTFGKPMSKLNSNELKQVKESYPFRVSEAGLKF